jgi:hypothetical protein
MSFTSGPYAAQAQIVLRANQDFQRKNTSLAYNPKIKEFKDFCHYEYPNSEHPTIVTEERTFAFLFYQAFRKLRPRGGSKKKNDETAFDPQDYERIKSEENPQGTCSYEVVNSYLCAVLKLHTYQRDESCNNLSKEQIRSRRVKTLLDMVKNRKKRIKKAIFAEKLDSEFTPYLLVQKVPGIEKALFFKNCKTMAFSQASLRDRFFFLMTHQGILRGESLVQCELSDLCDIVLVEEGPTPCQILVMQVATGKTNSTKTIYGRVMRHKIPELCPIGALGLYLMSRFHVAGEKLDFTSNEKWFSVKLLVEHGSGNTEKGISSQSYAKTIKEICNELELPSKHFIHIGRSVGAVTAEYQEMEGDAIENLGNISI